MRSPQETARRLGCGNGPNAGEIGPANLTRTSLATAGGSKRGKHRELLHKIKRVIRSTFSRPFEARHQLEGAPSSKNGVLPELIVDGNWVALDND